MGGINMKKKILPIILFVIVFVVCYISLCYMVPGLRIKLAAEPMEYFTKSIQQMIPLKSAISAIVALIAAGITMTIGKKHK